jgi:hypothetical protein
MAAVSAHAFQYAVLRAVPRIDRGEFINVGVIIYCQEMEFLRAVVSFDDARLRALAEDVDIDAVHTAAAGVVAACEQVGGSARKNDGLAARFGMLTAPRSTVVQPSPVHAGVTGDPVATLRVLLQRLVAPAQRADTGDRD